MVGVLVANKVYHPTELEKIFDQDRLFEFNSSLLSDREKRYFEILISINTKNYQDTIDRCEHLFQSSLETTDRLFALQWAVAATESVYDIPLRESWIKRWNLIQNWSQDYWSQFLFQFQIGLTYFFQGILAEAEEHFKECLSISIKNNYDRGIIRSYHHLGLIERDRRNKLRAKEFLRLALQKASDTQRMRMVKKIEGELNTLNINENFNFQSQKLISFLKENKLKEARQLLRNIQKLRKLEKRNPERESEYALWALFFFAINKQKSLAVIMQRLIDPLVRIKTFEYFKMIRMLTPEMEYEYSILVKNLKLNTEEEIPPFPNLPTTPLPKDAQRLLGMLSSHPHGLSKDQISMALWNQIYDPLYHDAKIYKLIMVCRKDKNIRHRLLNKYGFYILSPSPYLLQVP